MAFDLLTLAGLAGIFGAAACAVSDVFLLSRPTDGKTYYLDPLDAMTAMSSRRLALGNVLGVVTLPYAILGLFQVQYMLAPAGAWLSWPPVLFLGWMFCMGCASHDSWAFLGHIRRTQKQNPSTAIDALTDDAQAIWATIYRLSGMAYMLGSIWMAVAIFMGETHYPLWFGLLNPLLLFFGQEFIVKRLPAPWGGYLAPTSSNLVWVLLYAISTCLYLGISGA